MVLLTYTQTPAPGNLRPVAARAAAEKDGRELLPAGFEGAGRPFSPAGGRAI
jgi:hypothetical protein